MDTSHDNERKFDQDSEGNKKPKNESKKDESTEPYTACGRTNHKRSDCRFIKSKDDEINKDPNIPWLKSHAGKKCKEMYGRNELPSKEIHEKILAKSKCSNNCDICSYITTNLNQNVKNIQV